MNTRRNCTACRLAKCFLVGMSSYLIRKEEQKNGKYASVSKSSNNKHTVHNQAMVCIRIEQKS